MNTVDGSPNKLALWTTTYLAYFCCQKYWSTWVHRTHAPWHSPGLNSTSSFKRVSSRSSMFSTRRGTTSFCNVTEATVATPELGLEGRITFPVLPNRSMSTYKCVGGGSVWGDIWGEGGREFLRLDETITTPAMDMKLNKHQHSQTCLPEHQ